MPCARNWKIQFLPLDIEVAFSVVVFVVDDVDVAVAAGFAVVTAGFVVVVGAEAVEAAFGIVLPIVFFECSEGRVLIVSIFLVPIVHRTNTMQYTVSNGTTINGNNKNKIETQKITTAASLLDGQNGNQTG